VLISFHPVMAGGLVEGSVLGAVFQEGAKPITNQISKALKFRTTRKNLASLVDRVMPAAKEMKLLDKRLKRPLEEIDRVIDELEQGKDTMNKHSKVPLVEMLLFTLLPRRDS
jgi:septal ring factor EnvC (AmiA/AmiB activator)